MLWPDNERPAGQADLRFIVRGLHCVEGTATCELDLKAGCDFQARGISVAEYTSGFSIDLPKGSLRLWTSHTPAGGASRPHSEFSLREGEEFWAVLEWDVAGHGWSSEAARHALAQVEQHWGGWVNNLRPAGHDDPGLRRTAMIVHLLSYAPEGSVVAASATSLPERIDGGWNVDYRLWSAAPRDRSASWPDWATCGRRRGIADG